MAWPDTPDRSEAFHRVTDILRCKWTIAVLRSIEQGRHRPSEMQRDNPGLSSKVLSQRLRKLTDFGLVERRAFAEVPPRVEYRLTPRGRDLTDLVASIAGFAEHWAGGLSDGGRPPRRSARTT
ncbi:MAG TPA: helix-turn-helix domain-containing protein [Phycisphaerales bacterium]|nr:helix-turn-helix domain-containing protein [Phycisphaerales bacterium]